jgi:hypothetical protein
MARSEKGNSPGADRPYYETPAGIVIPSAFLSNGITGTPPGPAMRGGPGAVGSGHLGEGSPRTSNNGVPGQFFKKEGK